MTPNDQPPRRKPWATASEPPATLLGEVSEELPSPVESAKTEEVARPEPVEAAAVEEEPKEVPAVEGPAVEGPAVEGPAVKEGASAVSEPEVVASAAPVEPKATTEAPKKESPKKEAPKGDEPVGFGDLGLDERLVSACYRLGFEAPTPIQVEAIPVLVSGRDIVGGARTGSGKTAAFGLPLLQRVVDGERKVKALVLAPTRELALQVTEALRTYSSGMPVKMVTIYGGASYTPQLRALDKGVDAVVGTPGRVIDLIDRGALDLSHVEMLVLDEADEMLNMGFIEDVERVLDITPKGRQVALFSATMPSAIRRVADRYLNNPVSVQVESGALTVDHIDQQWIAVPNKHKLDALERVLKAGTEGTTLVFARTRRGCAEVADALAKKGVAVDALHGDLNQAARERVLGRLRAQRLKVVIATDVAARGIDVNHIRRVVNYDLPDDKEVYVHRIGRTGRAGRAGLAISFAAPHEKGRMRRLEHAVGATIKQVSLPSDSSLRKGQLHALNDELREITEHMEKLEVPSWLKHLTTEEDWSVEDLAAAALALLARSRGISLGEVSDEAPDWNKGRKRREDRGDSRPRRELNEVELFFPVGFRRGIRPGDLVGAIANEGQVPGELVGKVTILDSRCFVGLPRQAAEELMARSNTLTLRGTDYPLILAKPRGAGPRPHPGRKSYGGGGGNRNRSWNKKR